MTCTLCCGTTLHRRLIRATETGFSLWWKAVLRSEVKWRRQGHPPEITISGTGHREVRGTRVATSETGAVWNSFFADLVARALGGVSLVTSDAHASLVEVIVRLVARCRLTLTSTDPVNEVSTEALPALAALTLSPKDRHTSTRDLTTPALLCVTRRPTSNRTLEVIFSIVVFAPTVDGVMTFASTKYT